LSYIKKEGEKVHSKIEFGVDLFPERRYFISIDLGRFSITFFLTAKRRMNEFCAAILILGYHGIKIMKLPRLLPRQVKS